MTIGRLLVANRGEIALRVIRACRDLEIETVIAHSEADRASLPVELADRSVCIGAGPPRDSYLHIPGVLAAAVGTGCDAIHPGYGFLAESAAFARECEEAGLIFVGPRPDTIALLGDKIAGRHTAIAAGVPVIPGTPSATDDLAAAARVAEDIGYPVLIKAAGGGGGKGLRRVNDATDLARLLAMASAEAKASSGNAAVYIEKYIASARHIEVQIASDAHGTVLHFGERDCSVQRSYQKLVEEAPSPVLDDDIRRRISAAAVALVRHAGYLGVGTVEFLFDQQTGEFYFIEMNTRLQVEHPVTETVTGQDLVALQLLIATGAPLPLMQDDIVVRGHAIEFRVNAENPHAAFRPSAGRLTAWRPPAGPWVRTDTHCFAGYTVPPFYDSLLAKVIVHGTTRDETLRRARRALDEHVVSGIDTTLDLHRWLVRNDDFTASRIDTGWIERCWAGSVT